MNNLILTSIIILIFLGLFYLLNYLLKKNIENYGIFCGYYNLSGVSNNQTLCNSDINCEWHTKTNHNGRTIGWCSQKNIYS